MLRIAVFSSSLINLETRFAGKNILQFNLRSSSSSSSSFFIYHVANFNLLDKRKRNIQPFIFYSIRDFFSVDKKEKERKKEEKGQKGRLVAEGRSRS